MGTELKTPLLIGLMGLLCVFNGLRGVLMGLVGLLIGLCKDGLQPIIGSSLGAAPAGARTPDSSLAKLKISNLNRINMQ